MLHFFKIKRWRALRDHKFFKYSKYVIGEVFIVIIGILVALMLHNWNEKRQEQKYYDTVLIEVQKELIKNIETIRASLDFYNNRDSIVNKILYDSLTADNYNNTAEGFQLRGVVYRVNLPLIKNDAFKKLMINSQVISPEQDSLRNGLIELYNEKKEKVDIFTKEVDYMTTENVRSYEKYPWFKNQILYLPSEEATDYFLTNPVHIGQVTNYAAHALYAHRLYMEMFDLEAIKCYRNVRNYLANKNMSCTDSLLFGYIAEHYENFVGTYKVEKYGSPLYAKTDSVVITIENDQLMYRMFSNNSEKKREIVPVSNFYFRTVLATGFHRLHYNPEGMVSGLTWSNGMRMIKFKKVS